MTDVVFMCLVVALAVGSWLAYFFWGNIEAVFRKKTFEDSNRYNMVTFLIMGIAGVVFIILFNNPPAAVLAAVLIYSFRKRQLEIKEMERKALLEEQGEVALQIISSLYDTKGDILAAFEGAADSVPPPMSDELRRVVIEYRAGKSINEALTDFMERVDNRDFEILCKGIMLSEKYGTDTTAVVREVAEIIRDRIVLREELKNELRGQKLTIDVFLIAIPVVAALLYVFSPEARHTITSTTVGKVIMMILVCIEYAAWRLTRGQWVVEEL